MNGITIGGIILMVIGVIMLVVLFVYVNKQDRGQVGTFKDADGNELPERTTAIATADLSKDQKKWKNIYLGVLIGSIASLVIGAGMIGFGIFKANKDKKALEALSSNGGGGY